MTSTPPPPTTRARTPPTPLHGPKINSYEPYSPRRSNRIHNRDAIYSSSPVAPRNPSMPSNANHGKQQDLAGNRPRPRRTFQRTNSQTYSPPSSPISSPPQSRRKFDSSPRAQVKKFSTMDDTSQHYLDVDSDHMDASEGLLGGRVANGNDFRSRVGLPTPSKTPRKRSAPSEANIASAARVLFPSRLSNDDEIMPSPRKVRKSKKHTAFTLESFAEESDNQNAPPIEIYTDSKERIPAVDENDDNPFLVRRSMRRAGTNGSRRSDVTKAEPTTKKPKKTKYGMTKEIDEAVDNNEGMVYVFRGKKIFRRFDDNEEGNTTLGQLETDGFSDQEIRRRVGADASRPFTRSAMKPRLLFPPKDHVTDEEEAVTDIEGETFLQRPTVDLEPRVMTPVKKHFRPATPPTTGRRTRRVDVSNATPDSSPPARSSNLNTDGDQSRSIRRSAGPFDSWQRIKSSSSLASAATKRHATEPIEREGEAGTATSAKRARGN